MAYLKKQQRTRDQLKSALIELLKKKHFIEITIKEIAEAAGYDRSSFYRYYDDKYQLTEEIEEELIDRIERRALQMKQDSTNKTFDQEEIFKLLMLFEDPMIKVTIRLLLGENGDLSFEPRLKKMFKRIFDGSAQFFSPETVESRLIRDYLADLFIQTIRYQTSDLPAFSAQKLAGVLNDIYFHGFVAALHQQPHPNSLNL